MAEDFIVADTSVVLRLSKVSEHSEAYEHLLGGRRIAVSFQTPPELLGARIGPKRRQRVMDLIATFLKLPHAESTDVWYARVIERRKQLRSRSQEGSGASEADVWIISSTLEHRMALLSHDAQQIHLGRAEGLKVLTNLDGLKDDNPSG